MAIDPVYLCKDCNFCKMSVISTIATFGGRVGTASFMYKCTKTFRPAHEVPDPVKGTEKVPADMTYCEVERKYGDCGPTAKYWKPKHKKDLFKMLTKESYD